MRHPIAIPMEDPIIHTDDYPFCGDRSCPCFAEYEAFVAGLPPYEQASPKRQSTRTCLYCHREYTCWAAPDEPDGFCSERCEQALNALYEEPPYTRADAEADAANGAYYDQVAQERNATQQCADGSWW